MSYMYGICCVPLVKNSFFKSLPLPKKKRSDCESQKSGLGFYGFMIRFWICLKHYRIMRFWIRKSGFGLSQKNAPLVETVPSSTDEKTEAICTNYAIAYQLILMPGS